LRNHQCLIFLKLKVLLGKSNLSYPEIEKITSSSKMYASTKRLKIFGKTIETPKRIISLSNKKYSEGISIKSNYLRGFSEIYKTLNKEKLQKMESYNGEERKFINSIGRVIDKSNAYGDIIFSLYKYDSRSEKERKESVRLSEIPKEKEIEYLFDLLHHNYNDILIPPLMPYLTGKNI